MSASPRKNRLAFRPALNDVRLEDRVVLNATPRSALIGAGAWGAARQEHLALRQVQRAYLNQLRASQNFLTQFANNQAALLYQTPGNLGPDGRPTQTALGNYSNSMAGGINATTFRLSAQTSLLPHSGRLVEAVQHSLIGLHRPSLASRVANLIDSGRATHSQWMLQRWVNRDIQQTFRVDTAALGRYFHTTPVNRLSIDPATGQRIPITQYLGNQAVGQINNIFGALVNSVDGIAQQTIFDADGNFVPSAVPTFEQLYVDALATAATQLSGVLALFPNGQSLASQLQDALFATGTNPQTGLPNVSLFNALLNTFPPTEPVTPAPVALAVDAPGGPVVGPGGPVVGPGQGPFDLSQFRTTFQNQFTPAYESFLSPINNFFGATPTTGLPNGFFQAGATFPNIFNQAFTASSFNSGFNNGFLASGSGFPGFGVAPSAFSPTFGTGFNGLVTSMNQPFGFNAPTFNNGV